LKHAFYNFGYIPGNICRRRRFMEVSFLKFGSNSGYWKISKSTLILAISFNFGYVILVIYIYRAKKKIVFFGLALIGIHIYYGSAMLHEIMGWILFLGNTKNIIIIIWGPRLGSLLTSRLPYCLSLSPRPMRGYHVAGHSNSSH
jgi:hypothetical protein